MAENEDLGAGTPEEAGDSFEETQQAEGGEGGELDVGEPAPVTGPALRIRQRQTRRELEAELAEHRQLLQEIHAAATAPREEPQDPNLDQLYEQNPRAWYERKLSEELAEIRAYVQEQRESQRMSYEERAHQERIQAETTRVFDEMKGAVAEYEETEHGAGFTDRMTYWFDKLQKAHLRTGVPPQVARHLAGAEVAATRNLGMRFENEFQYMDMVFSEKLGLPPANGNGHQPVVPRRPAADSGRVAAGRSGLAGSIGQPGPTTPPSVRLGDKPTVDEVRRAVAAARATGRTANVWDVIAKRQAPTR